MIALAERFVDALAFGEGAQARAETGAERRAGERHGAEGSADVVLACHAVSPVVAKWMECAAARQPGRGVIRCRPAEPSPRCVG